MENFLSYLVIMLVIYGVYGAGLYMGKREKKLTVEPETPPEPPQSGSMQKVELLTLSIPPPDGYVPDPEVVKMDDELDDIQHTLNERRTALHPDKRKELEQKYDTILNSMVDKFLERAENQRSSSRSGSL